PCGFTRRVGLELPGFAGPVPVEGPVKAAQFDADLARLVVEVPALGFAWFPKSGPAGAPPRPKLRLAEGHFVRNEFLEAEVDPQSGGVKIVRDLRTRRGRLAQQLVFHPGSRMQARAIHVTVSGPALGELVTEGDLVDEHGEVLATFRQRLRAWLSRPVLELRV